MTLALEFLSDTLMGVVMLAATGAVFVLFCLCTGNTSALTGWQEARSVVLTFLSGCVLWTLVWAIGRAVNKARRQ